MHPNPVFHTQTSQQNLAFAREKGFGVLAVNGPDVPLLSHIPFLLNDDGTSADLHLVRSNPISRACRAPLAARLAVSGPYSYISPDWYEVPDQVPTWNYVAVHLMGSLEPLPDNQLRDLLDRQSAFFEEQLEPKPQWKTTKMTPDILERMMRQIRPFRLHINDVQGTWKLNQNKPDDVRLRAAEQVADAGIGSERAALAALMHAANGQE